MKDYISSLKETEYITLNAHIFENTRFSKQWM